MADTERPRRWSLCGETCSTTSKRTRHGGMLAAIVMSLAISVHKACAKSSTDVTEYCQFDHFNANCHPNEAIVVTSAHYGRMRTGTCISGEGYLGCTADLRSHMNNLCSGRQSCDVDVSTLANVAQPCRKDFVSYLEASYKCVDVMVGSSKECYREQYEITSSRGFLVNPAVYGSSAGTEHCPWVFRAQTGQRIQLRAFVYGEMTDESVTPSDDPPACSSFVHVTEAEADVRVSLCGVGDRRDYELYQSTDYQLQVYFENKSPVTSVFMIEFKVTGCADVPVSPDMVVERRDAELVIRCAKNTRETWYLTCQENRWVGEMGNCSTPRTAEVAQGLATPIPFPQGLIIAVTLGVLLGVIIGFVSLTLLYIYRRREFQRRNVMLNENTLDNYVTGEELARRRCQGDSKESSSLLYDTTHLPPIESGRRPTKPTAGRRTLYRDAVGKRLHVYEGQRATPTEQPSTEIYFDLDPQQSPHRQSM